MVCKLARVLYAGFKEDPSLRKLLGEPGCIYTFFGVIEELARQGVLTALCLKVGGATASAAVLSVGARPRRVVLPRGLTRLLACLRLRGLLTLAAWLAWAPGYARTYSKLGETCHLLFIASLAPGRGYGSKLLREIEKLCRSAGARTVTLEVDTGNPALLFYAKRGFTPLMATVFAGRYYLLMAKLIGDPRPRCSGDEEETS
uniref:GNAT family N-acetyltransferase n=1 Tax=Thermofilum pendens TaxID=2269 RepID=A0A7C4FE84_THEPE